MTTDSKTKPVDEVREGSVRLPIWARSGSNGTFYTAGKPELSYNRDGEWRESGSYSEIDLECLALAALAARKKIRQLSKQSDTGSDAEAGK